MIQEQLRSHTSRVCLSRTRPASKSTNIISVITGIILSLLIFFIFNYWYDRSARKGLEWAQRETFRRLPVACIASPWFGHTNLHCDLALQLTYFSIPIALFWLGWTSWDTVSPILPSIGGLFFGIGFQLIFMAMSNYITDVFQEYSASAQAAASCIRSLGAVLLPLTAESMYHRLGIHWAPSLLGFLSLVMGVIPFVFIKFESRMHKSRIAR